MKIQKVIDSTIRDFLINSNKYGVANNNSLYSSVLFIMDIVISDRVDTVASTPNNILINEEWFMEQTQNDRLCALAHEMEHVLRLHSVRRGNRDPHIWNIATDYVINKSLHNQGYRWEKFKPILNIHLDDNKSEEEMYEDLIENSAEIPVNPMGSCCAVHGDKDHKEMTSEEIQQAKVQTINTVSKIIQQSRSSSSQGSSVYERILDKFINPKVPWHSYLRKYLTKYNLPKITWKHRNRRFKHVYIPKSKPYTNKLIDLNYYVDVSGSITEDDFMATMSEIREIKNVFNPEKLNIIGFDTEITQEVVVKGSEDFRAFKLNGGGGTYLHSVYEHIKANRPTVAIIFSDLCCEEILEPDCDVIWLKLGNWGFTPKFGKVIQYEQ